MSNSVLGNRPIREKSELESAYEKLLEIEQSKKYPQFYTFLRTTGLPYIPCSEDDVEVLYQKCFETLHKLGEVSIPVSVALSMHYYVLASIATYPFKKTSTQYWKREILLNKIKKERLFIANTGSVRTYDDVLGNKALIAMKEKDNYIVYGEAPFMSLAGIADYLVFTAELSDGGKAVFFAASDATQIEFTDTAFDNTMQGSYTKSVKFKNLRVPVSNVIKLDANTKEESELLIYQRSWFQALVSAPYLGASQRVIHEVSDFARQKIKKGKRLSESENFSDNLGELILKSKGARQLCKQAGHSLSKFKRGDKALLETLFEASVLSKYFATHYAEEIVTQARHIMGTQFLSPRSITNKIYKEIVFGPLQPMTDIDIKAYFSQKL
ncbi:acyl-CoA dehydrogenase family protein [Ulvibacterium sp.]|uniref:acyl-CoA dehydrogenase family protein n=1 Tax=Ulvibacterium sp. TaxID=2665914 RepID=UPI00260BF83E|nr:acyl-CoA dehydrogenase family protein [Ulvibacterium sp.]